MQRLEKLLKKGSGEGLEKLVQRAQKMDRLSRTVTLALTPDLAAQMVAANLRDDGQLVIVCRTSAGAARLRYEEDAILEAVRANGVAPTGFRVKVGR